MKISLGYNDKDGDNKLSLFICAFFFASALNVAVKNFFSFSATSSSLISVAFGAVIIFSLVLALPTLFYRSSLRIIVTESCFIFLFLVSHLMNYAQPTILFNTAFWTLFVCIPFSFAGVSIYSKEILFHRLKNTSFFLFPFLCIALLNLRGSYNMSLSYMIILPILFFIYSYFNGKKIYDVVFAVFGILLIFLYGARGPLLCIFFYLFVKIFLHKLDFWKIVFCFSLIVIMVSAVLYWDDIIQYIRIFLYENGIKSYVLHRLVSGSFTESISRDSIRNYYFELIEQRPFLGYGLMGGWLDSGLGPHNMLIEFILAFGILGGGVLSLCMIVILLKSIVVKNNILYELVLILASCNFTMFFVSGNWLAKPFFFLYVFLAIANFGFFKNPSKVNHSEPYA